MKLVIVKILNNLKFSKQISNHEQVKSIFKIN